MSSELATTPKRPEGVLFADAYCPPTHGGISQGPPQNKIWYKVRWKWRHGVGWFAVVGDPIPREEKRYRTYVSYGNPRRGRTSPREEAERMYRDYEESFGKMKDLFGKGQVKWGESPEDETT